MRLSQTSLLVPIFAGSLAAQTQTSPSKEPAASPSVLPSAVHSVSPLRKIGGSVLPPAAISTPAPQFSDQARQAKIGGSVLVYAEVDTAGLPQHVHVIRGVGMGLDEKAVEAVRQYRFRPATEDGKPVAVAMSIEVNFQIADHQ